MEKIIKSEFFEVWFSDGKKYWNYDLHEVLNFVRYYRPVSEKMTCVVMRRRDYINSVIVSMLNCHELRFNC